MSSWKRFAAFGLAAAVAALPSKRATNFCGKSDSQVISGTPWIVFNMLYNEDLMSSSDSWCTVYDSTTTSPSVVQEIKWGSTSSISPASDTVKGYSFIGLTQNLENTLTDIKSIPASYQWTRSNTTEFKGNIVFDFMTNDVKGDSTSTDSHELMLWLQYEGGQTPIGWGTTPAYTVDSLFGTSWKLYEGVNEDTGITVSSLLPDTQFDGAFSGDLTEWFQVFVTRGTFKNSTYLNIGNAGTEIFYGDSTMSSTLALQIDLSGSSNAEDAAAEAAISKSAVAATSALATKAVSSPTYSATPVASIATAIVPIVSSSSTASTTSGLGAKASLSLLRTGTAVPRPTSAPNAEPTGDDSSPDCGDEPLASSDSLITTTDTIASSTTSTPTAELTGDDDSDECSDEPSESLASSITTADAIASATSATPTAEPTGSDEADDCGSDESSYSTIPSSTIAAASKVASIFPSGAAQPSGVPMPTGFPYGFHPHWRPEHHHRHPFESYGQFDG